MPHVEVEPIVTADLPIPRSYAFRGGGPVALQVAGLAARVAVDREDKVNAHCLAYVVRHPSAGPILIDTGFHPDAATDLRKDLGTPMGLMFRGLRPAAQPFDAQLREAGVDPAGVERVVMTHLHVDHTSGMRLLPNARFVCWRREWRAATARGAGAKGYVRHHLPHESRMELVEFADGAGAHGPISRTIDLLGDGAVRLVATPGHTPGHLSVLLRTDGGAEVLIAGDAAYTLRSIDEQVLPLLTADDAEYARSLSEVKAFADAHPGAPIVPTHDPDAWRRLATAAPAPA